MSDPPDKPIRDVPIDWEALEDAFENNAPEVHSYLHVPTGDVLRVVDGVADPQMHARIHADAAYVRIAPVSSREQYRWMERFIPLVEDVDLRGKLSASIDGKGAFRRFKDVLMTYAGDRERWFVFRSERLRTFMEAWLTAHAIQAVPRQVEPDDPSRPDEVPLSVLEAREARKQRNAELMRKHVRELLDSLGPRDLEALAAFGEFLRARRIARSHPPPPLDSGSAEEPTSGELEPGSAAG